MWDMISIPYSDSTLNACLQDNIRKQQNQTVRAYAHIQTLVLGNVKKVTSMISCNLLLRAYKAGTAPITDEKSKVFFPSVQMYLSQCVHMPPECAHAYMHILCTFM